MAPPFRALVTATREGWLRGGANGRKRRVTGEKKREFRRGEIYKGVIGGSLRKRRRVKGRVNAEKRNTKKKIKGGRVKRKES